MLGSIGIVAAIGLVILVAGVLLFLRFKPGTTFGSADFGPWPGASAPVGKRLPPGLVLGKTQAGELAGWSGEEHWLLVAPTGAGKSTGVLIPSIMQWGGNFMAVDIKGELALSCAPALHATGTRCLALDPFDVLQDNQEITKVGMDPVSQAANASVPVVAFRKLAELLIDRPGTQDVHWAEAARTVVTGMVASASAAKSAANQGMRGVVHLVDEGYGALQVLERMPWPDHIEPLVLRATRLLGEASVNERGAIMSTIRRQLGFLASEQVLQSLRGTWHPSDLVDTSQNTALFVILPAEHLSTHGRLLRLVTGCIVEAMLQTGPNRTGRLLYVIDEAAALGHLETIEQGIGLFRGYGAKFVLSFQDEQQLLATYGTAGAGSIRANCIGAYWACRDLETCQRVSAMLGEQTVVAGSRELTKIPLGEAGTSGQREVGRPLLLPDEVRRLPKDTMLCFIPGHYPTKLNLLKPGEFQAITYSSNRTQVKT